LSFPLIRYILNTVHNSLLFLLTWNTIFDYYFMFFSSLFLENFFYILFVKNHLLILTCQTLTHITTPDSGLKTFAVISVTTYFLTSTSSCVQNLIFSLSLHYSIFFSESQRIYFFGFLDNEISDFWKFFFIKTIITTTIFSTCFSGLKTYTV